MFNFTPEKVDSPSNTLPTGTLAWAVVTVKAIKPSQNTGGELAELELTLLGGSYEGRKLFTRIGSPLDENNSEAYRQMGFAAVLHMMESSGVVNIADPQSYAWLNAVSFTDMMAYLDGKAVAIKTRIEKDKGGNYPDRDGVGEFLSPNPARSSPIFKGYQALAEGKETMKPAVPTPPAVKAGGLPFGVAAQTVAPIANGFAQPQPGTVAANPAPAAQTAFVPIAGAVPAAAAMGAPAGVPIPGQPPLPPRPAGPPPMQAGAPAVGPGAAAPGWIATSGTPVPAQQDGMP